NPHQFFNEFHPDTKTKYESAFSLLYAILVNYEQFPDLVELANQKMRGWLAILKNGGDKLNALLDLFNYMMMKNDQFLNVALYPYLLQPKTHRIMVNHSMIKKMLALMSFCKRAVYLRNVYATVLEFVAKSDWENSEFTGWAKLVQVLRSLQKQKGDYNKTEVIGAAHNTLYVNGVRIEPSYLTNLYEKALAKNNSSNLVNFWVFEKFAFKGDICDSNLTQGYVRNIWQYNGNTDKKVLIEMIDSMTHDLLVACYASGANTYRFTERIVMQTEMSCILILHIQTFTNKNRKFDNRLRLLPVRLGKMMIAYLLARRALYLELHDTLPKVKEMEFFNHRISEEHTSGALYHCHFFGTVQISHMAMLLGEPISKVIKLSLIRKAISYWMRNIIIDSGERARAHALAEKIQGHSVLTSLKYGGKIVDNDDSVTKPDYEYYFYIFKEYFHFFRIEIDVTQKVVVPEVIIPSPQMLLDADGQDVKEAIGNLHLTQDQSTLLYDMTLSTGKENLVICAGCGFGKTSMVELMIKAHKIASRRTPNKSIVNVMLVPFEALKCDVIDRFKKARFTNFIYNFFKDFPGYGPGTLIFDKCHSLVDGEFRKFKRLDLKFSDNEEELNQHDSSDNENNSSFLAGMFCTIDITNEQVTLLKQLEDSTLQEEGEEFYRKICHDVARNPSSIGYFYPPAPNTRDDLVFERPNPKVTKPYSKFFGKFYAIMLNYQKFPFLVSSCDEKTGEYIDVIRSHESVTAKYEALLNLFDYFIMKNDNMMSSLLLPYLINIENGKLKTSHITIKKIQAMRSFCKRVVLLKSDYTGLWDFVRHSTLTNSKYIGWAKLVYVYQELAIERSKINKFQIVESDNQVLHINGTKIEPSYFKELYEKALNDFQDKFRVVGEIVGDVRKIEEVYNMFVERGDKGKDSLISEFKYQIFEIQANIEKKSVIDIIDTMTIDLLIASYISGGNSFTFRELQTVQFQAPGYEKRNTLFIVNSLFIKTFSTKTGKFEGTLRVLSPRLGKYMIAYILAIRPLYNYIHDGMLPKVKEDFFYRTESEKHKSDLLYKCYTFVNSNGKFITSYEFKNQISKLLGVNKFVPPRLIREAMSYYFREYIDDAANSINQMDNNTFWNHSGRFSKWFECIAIE
ncbi:hypothetical protein JA1_004655, partial [Spathaspora sp. JA1]